MVLSTVVLTTVVIFAVGWFLLRQTRDGLLEHRADVVVAEAERATEQAAERLTAADRTESDVNSQQRELVDQIIRNGEARGFSVILGGPMTDGYRLEQGGAERTSGVQLESVPAAMEQRFDEVASTAYSPTEIITTDADGVESRVPGIVVGSQVALPADGNVYTLYFLFPLNEERETLSLVTRALLTAGIALVLLVAGVSWLVSRQVVAPIRMTRQVAERLAAGRLQERLRVRGEDDLARLAASFNQMASNLQKQIRQLEELSRVQRQFASDVSHELRTPLTTVRMAGDVLFEARDEFDPVTARAAELLQGELDRFESLLVDLLEISRIDAGVAVLEAETTDLTTIAQSVAESTRPLAERRGVRVVVQAPPEPVLAEVDPRRVERIVRNLVTNAIDHADVSVEDPVVVVRLAADDEAAAVVVRDYGVGLGPGEAATVFNRFWRADPARARTSGGTGLGLSISLEDTHLHGGWLQAWGRPGRGAQFRLTLPRVAGTPLRHSPLPLVPQDAREGAGK